LIQIWRAYERFLFLLLTTLAFIIDIGLPFILGWFVATRFSLAAGIGAGVLIAAILVPAGVGMVLSARSMLRQGIA
jgi:hypothetical protein